MKTIRTAFLVIPLAFGLTACEWSKSQIETTFGIACSALPKADEFFQAYVASGRVSPAVIAAERAAVAEGQALCAAPPTNIKTALAAVRRVTSTVLKAIATAKAQSQGG